MSNKIRWGIIGTGYVAKQFAEGLRLIPDAQLLAITSRTASKAQEFAKRYQVERVYNSSEDLVKDPDIDVVYIATPPHRHEADCVLCLESGKAILCEKPFTTTAKAASEVINLARQKQLFCMEAMWMRFIPLIQEIKQLIDSGTIGEIRTLSADFGVPTEFSPSSHLFNPELGGGALLDRGIYTLNLAVYLLGIPAKIMSQARRGKTGVDEEVAIILSYPQGALATLSASLTTYTSNQALIAGTKGKITIHEPFYCSERASITTKLPIFNPSLISTPSTKQKLVASVKSNSLLKSLYLHLASYLSPLTSRSSQQKIQPFIGNGYQYEALEVMRCLQQGKIESEIMPLDETLKIMELVEQIRDRW
ncbi:Gfo/Idh/MocA family protein [Merismopedia glauca]|uniref:Dehydrogenase n=1 Tax=Merismopedia glauca CCAP 1448/3 TaxID=1296344 RepID=A0A2T1CAC6_9CYAN|nr:Gfo/Idh/MocA family oxidoreductase [Merismopedia glauca]PSB05118.1 dehydrogenase [Merismopedia glauca CCAP 1448/3]